MADSVNPNADGSKSSNFLPKFYQSDANKKFLQATVDQLVQPGTVKKINGYIGRENAKATTGDDIFVAAATTLRQQYQLEPGLVVNDKLGNNTFFKDYQDYINQLEVFGGNLTNHARINEQEMYSWDPHINWDKFVNFQNYYWLPYGPDVVAIAGQQDKIESSYKVTIESQGDNNTYMFNPTGLVRNPTLKLYRGQTYKFVIDSPSNPFSFKTTKTLGSQDRYLTSGLDKFAVTNGTITFTVPYGAPDLIYYISENDIDLGGPVQILSIDENTSIDVGTEVLGKQTYKLSNGTALSNGMKVRFIGNVTPAEYATGYYYVEGVGTGITLINENSLELVSAYTTSESILFDTIPFDSMPFSDATAFAGTPDYIVVNRASYDLNPWSRYNRWFHKDAVEASALFNDKVPSLDQSARARRPIIEFEANLRLFNFGTTAIPDVDLIDTFTTDVFSTIEGSVGYNIDGISLTQNQRVLFTADTDVFVKNKIFKVTFSTINNVRQMHLVLENTPTHGDIALVKQGLTNQGKTYWYDGTTWKQAQQKTKLNQSPLFDVYDNDGYSYSDNAVYDGSTFLGTKLFSYKVRETTPEYVGDMPFSLKVGDDITLGFPLSFKNIENIGDIVFTFNLAYDSFQYKNITDVLTKSTSVGYLQKINNTTESFSYVNGWQLCTVPVTQAALRIYKNSKLTNNFYLDIFDDISNLPDLAVKVYVNGIRLDKDKWEVVDDVVYKKIVLTSDIKTSDVLTIRAFAKQPINSNGYYEIPVNLQNNPLNSSIRDFTLGEVIDHVSSIVDNLDVFTGTFPGTSNLRDVGNITQYGTKFVQHSGPASLSLYHVTSTTNNIVKAIEKSRDDYNRFKRNFIAIAESLGVDTDPVKHVDLILQKINRDKPSNHPYFFSDMVPYGASIKAEINIVDSRVQTYPLTNVFNLTSLSTKAVIIYYTDITTNKVTQLLYGQDYTFSDQGFVVITSPLAVDDLITIYEYDNTNGSFVPSTPTKLGIWPKYTPKKYLDTSLVTPREMIQGHDGSQVLAYGDYRDELILEIEKRIYNNIKVIYDPTIFDVRNIVPGYNRETPYSLAEFNQVLAPSFYKWTSYIDKDFTKPLSYDRLNSLTFNYRGHSAPDGRETPGYWRGIYRWLLDTDRPNIAPWEMLDFSEEPSWWTDVYGPAPYTSDNLVMWQDLTDGVIRQPGVPPLRKVSLARPFLIDKIPVDEQGNIISPLMSGLSEGITTASTAGDFVFGDVSPIEASWRRSSHYPFSVLLAAMLLQPAKTFGTLLDRSRIVRNIAGQLIYSDTGLRVTPASIKLPSIYSSTDNIQTSGIINYIVDYILSDNLRSYNSYIYDLQQLEAKLSYRIGAFTSKEKFNLLLDSKTPLSQGSVFVPPEDYSIILNSSSPVKKITYSGVIITKLSDGFEIKGYSKSQPYFKSYPWIQSGISINVGGISESYIAWTTGSRYAAGKVVLYNGKYYRVRVIHTAGSAFDQKFYEPLASLPVLGGRDAMLRRAWDRSDPVVVPYGTKFRTSQEVVDFLLGYGEYLKDQGFIFDEYNSALNAVTNWETSAKEFLFWTTQNWSSGEDKWTDWVAFNAYSFGEIVQYNGDYYRVIRNSEPSAIFTEDDFVKLDGLSSVGSSVISLSPAATKLSFVTDLCVVDDITNSFNGYEVFKVDGTPIEPDFLNSYRDDNAASYEPASDDGIFGGSFYLIQKEQVLLLNNTTMFNDTIYNPSSGYRQERIKVAGYVSTNWYGGFNVPGFIFDQAVINEWASWKDYALGDIVKYKEFFYSASSFLVGSESFEPTSWIRLEGAPTAQLLPNWSYKANQFTDFYSLDSDNFDPSQQAMAQHLIGYQKRQYLSNIIQDGVSEFKFYQGMIIEKGTQNVFNKLFDVLSADGQESLKFYEEWALRVGQYGASSAFENIEFVLDEALFKNNPQGFELVNEIDTNKVDFIARQTPNDVYLKPLGYDNSPWPIAVSSSPYLRTPGYVRSDEVAVTLTTFDDILTQDISQFANGDYVWVGFEGREWNVYRYTDADIEINDVAYDEVTKELTITTSKLTSLVVGNIIGITQVSKFSGFYKIKSITLNKLVVDADIVDFPDPFVEQGTMVVFVFTPQRAKNLYDEVTGNLISLAIDRADELLPRVLKENELLWVDDAGQGKWSTWKFSPVYNNEEIANTVNANGLAYGRKVIINNEGVIAIVSNNLGELAVYDKASLASQWIQRQTITAPFISNNNAGSNATPDYLTGSVLALSADATWLASGTPLANNVSTAYNDITWNDQDNDYAVGVIVSYQGRFFRSKVTHSPADHPLFLDQLETRLNLAYWKELAYVVAEPFQVGGINSTNSQQGVITIYRKDSNNIFEIVDTIISPMPAAGELFGSSLAFGNNTLFVGATGANDEQGVVYELNYKTRTRVTTSYNPSGSAGLIVKVTSSVGIEPGMAIVGAGFNSGQVVTSVIDSTTIRLNLEPDDLPVGIINFTSTGWGYGNTFVSPQELPGNFGTSISISKDNSTLLISAPGESVNSLYLYKNIDNQYINIDELTGTVSEPEYGLNNSVSDDGLYIAVSSIYADVEKTDQGSVTIYKYVTSIIDNEPVSQYELYQQLINPNPETAQFFGSKVAFMNDAKTLVVYSKNADSYSAITVDKYLDTYDSYTFTTPDGIQRTSKYVGNPASGTSARQTTFDNNITRFVTTAVNGGRVDVYDQYGTKWIFSESLKNENNDNDGYGEGFAVGANYIVVSAPYAEVNGLKTGRVFQYGKAPNTYSWSVIHNEIAKPDVSKIKQAFLYNKTTNKLVTYLDVIDSNQGKIPGPADQEIKYKTFYDPATYSVGDGNVNVDDGMAWTASQVGMLWWDLRTAKFYDSYDNDIVYRNGTWNTLFPGASIDVYEWVESRYIPSEWNTQADTEDGLADDISGQTLYGDEIYSVVQKYDNVAKTFRNTYYYWVKNKRTVPNVPNRQVSSQDVANLISNPRGAGYKYIALTSANSFSLVNIKPNLADADVVLSIEYWTVDKIDKNIHTQWKLISTNPDTAIPSKIEDKWFDSLCGKDIYDRIVPDTTLPVKIRYGVENRPRQGMFVNRFEALKQLFENVNSVLINQQITESRDITALLSFDPAPSIISGLYDTVLDTDAELRFAGIGTFTSPSAIPVIVNGKIVDVTIINKGSGYLVAPYITVTGQGSGAKIRAVIGANGRISGAEIISQGSGYDATTTFLTIRNYTVLVKSDSQSGGNWSTYGYEPQTQVWSRIQTQTYDTRRYWTYVDWYASGYNQFTATDYSANTLSDLNTITAEVGDTVKILTSNNSGWMLLEKYANSVSIDWTQSYRVIGMQNGTVQFKSSLYQFTDTPYGYDGTLYDVAIFDNVASRELRNILVALKNNILIDNLKSEFLNLFFITVRYALSEQNYIDWIFKTSFVKVQHNVGDLAQHVTYRNDNLSNFEDYVSEVKPYRTKIREYISGYSKADTAGLSVTDFDIPPVFENDKLSNIVTNVIDGKISANSNSIITYPWKHWLDNVGFVVTEMNIVDGGSGYITEPAVRFVSNSGSGATARAFIANGKVNRIVLSKPGSGYLSAPEIIIDGGLAPIGEPAKVIATIGKGVIRSSLVKMKFDRITQAYYITSLQETETLVGTGSRLQFPLTWAPDSRAGKSTVSINGVDTIGVNYTLSIAKSTTRGYTSYSGSIKFDEAPPSGSTITVTYIKDWSMLNAADRIQYYYNPTTGELGKDLAQLMTGIDYGGVIVSGLGFDVSGGWGSLPYYSDKWDSFDGTFDDYIVSVDANTSVFTLPYVPALDEKINVYYSKLDTISYVSDGITTGYNFSIYNIFPPQVHASKQTRVLVSPNNVAGSNIITVTNIPVTVSATGNNGAITVTVADNRGIYIGMTVTGQLGLGAGTVTVTDIFGNIIQLSVANDGAINGNLIFTDTTDTGTRGLKVGDVLTVTPYVLDTIGYNTKIVEIINNTDVRLDQILFKNVPSGSTATFTRELISPTDYTPLASGTVQLSDPLPNQIIVTIQAFSTPVRIDDPAYVGAPIANKPSVIMPTWLGDGTRSQVNIFEYTPVIDRFTITDGDQFILRKSTSDGSIKPQDADYDTALSGGDLTYSSATGLRAEDIILDGDGFVTPTSSPAPEEVVPGQVVDAVAIKVYDKPSRGSANIKLDSYIGDGNEVNFAVSQQPNSPHAIVVKTQEGQRDIDGNIESISLVMTDGVDYTYDYTSNIVTFINTPAVGINIAIFSFGFNGSNILDLDYFIGDASTTEFITKAPWLETVTSLVYVNGQPQSVELFQTDASYENADRIGIRFTVPPAVGALINFVIVSGPEQTFSVMSSQKIVATGTDTYSLTSQVGDSLPSESNMIVRVGDNIISGPTNVYFKIKGNQINYTVDPTKFLPYSVSNQNISVLISGKLLEPGIDYNVDLSGITVRLNQLTRDTNIGAQLIVSVKQSQGYAYLPNPPRIKFTQAPILGEIIEVISAYKHDILDIQSTAVTITSTVVVTPNTTEFYTYTGLSGGYIVLDRPVIDDRYVWVIKDGKLLTPSIDFKVNSDKQSITLAILPAYNETYTLLTFSSDVLGTNIAYMQFKDMLNRIHYKRLSAAKQTRLTLDLTQTATTITVDDATTFDLPNRLANKPGVIEIRGERIEYYTLTGNVLGQIRRGTLGTGVPLIHKAGSYVQDIGASETIPYIDVSITEAIVSDGTNIIPINFIPTKGFKDDTLPNYEPTGVVAWFTEYGYNLTASSNNNFDATYRPTSMYAKNDVVIYNNLYYVNIKSSIGIEPTVTTPKIKWQDYWQQFNLPMGYGQSNDIEVFVGGTRLKKKPYKVHSISNHPESPEGDVQFDAEFSVNGNDKFVKLTVAPAFGTRITVVKRTGTDWDGKNTVSILDDENKVARFLKDSPGIWYNTIAKYEKKVATTFDNGAGTFDSSNVTMDQG
jgi:hypothetical protein